MTVQASAEVCSSMKPLLLVADPVEVAKALQVVDSEAAELVPALYVVAPVVAMREV